MKQFYWIISILILSPLPIIPQNIGSTAAIEVNNIYLPFNNRGVIADVNVLPGGSLGQFEGFGFLFSSGFWLSGYSNDSMWANGVASASLVSDFQAGIVGMDPNDPTASIYKLKASDIPFSQSWQDWIDAVSLGADFYDGDGDGVYNPVDLNGNNQWDPNEDKPDLIADETYWCVFNDGVPPNQRRWHEEPLGIEIKQTIFAFASTNAVGNSVFVRYRIKNTGLVADTLNEVYFTVYADADIGDASDDLIGVDTIRQGIFFYNQGADPYYGNNAPAFMMDLLTSPYEYIPGETFIDLNGNDIYDEGIDTPLDTAWNFKGPLGVNIYPGAKNLSCTSGVFQIGGDPELHEPSDVIEVRNCVNGLTAEGLMIDPCNWYYGDVRGGVLCNEVNPYFWCSGDPVSNVGWIAIQPRDVRGQGSAGPFTLIANRETEILIGYEIDNASTPIGGITAVRNVSDFVQEFYTDNFGYPIILSAEDQNINPNVYSLSQNYPNPFNPTTKIRYELPQDGKVRIELFDILGQKVRTLVDEFKTADRYEVIVNLSDLASGVYIYRMKINDFVKSKKMVFIK